MDEAASKGLSIPLTVFLTLLVVTFGIIVYTKTKPIQKTSLSQEDTVIQSITANNFSAYDNQNVSGADVVGAINTKASSSVAVVVKTASDMTGIVYRTASYNITDSGNPDYIENTASFKALLGKTANGTVTSITFIQQ